MLLPQSASGGRCFRLGSLWSNRRCTCELTREARLKRLQAVFCSLRWAEPLYWPGVGVPSYFSSLCAAGRSDSAPGTKRARQRRFLPPLTPPPPPAFLRSAGDFSVRRSRKWLSGGRNLRGKCRRFARNHGDDSNYTFYLWTAAARSPAPVFNAQKRQRNNRGQQ